MHDGYYIREAQRCRDFAAAAPDSQTASRWHKLADEYTVLAEELDAYIHHRPPLFQMPQRTQQQQSEAK
jgi:hypothetical protein